jgi:hypothetical protein
MKKLLATILISLLLTAAALADTTVYVTNTGSKYHRAGCRYLKQSRIPISLEEAEAQGYSACSVCN